MCARQQPIGKKLTSGLRGVWSCCWSGMCQVCLGRQSESHFSRRACWSTHIKICASLRQRRTKRRPGGAQHRASCGCILGLRGRCCGSHTARSGQEPHTPGGTKNALWVRGEPRKTAGPTLRGAARSRTLQEGPRMRCVLAVSPGKPLVPHCEERPGAAHSRRDQECVTGWR